MTDKQETSADIIAEMRRRIAVKMSDAWYTQEEWRKLCDRLEAAHKRELSKNVSKNGADFGQLGDCAKLREFARLVSHMNDDGYWNGSASICALVSKADAALAAPQRNCDMFGGDYKKLNAVWFDWTGTPDGQNADGTVKLTFAEWLFAPATEQEGGNDGNE